MTFERLNDYGTLCGLDDCDGGRENWLISRDARPEGCTRTVIGSGQPTPHRVTGADAGRLGAQGLVEISICRQSDLSSHAAPSGHRSRVVARVGTLLSGSAVVLVDQPAEHVNSLDRACRRGELVGRHGDLETDPPVWS